MRKTEHTFREWVSLQCLNIFDLLTRMAEHTSSKWVVWAFLNHLKKCLILCSGCNSLPVSQYRTVDWLSFRRRLWWSFCMPTLNAMIPIHLLNCQSPIWTRTCFSPSLLVCWMSLCLYYFLFILLFYQQHYSSAWRIPFGTLTQIPILWTCSRHLSHYMLKVESGRKWR